MPKPITPTCPACNYDITGIPLDDILYTYCPECGEYIKPISSNSIADQQHTKKQRITIFVITAFAILIALCILAAIIFFTLMIFAFNF